MTVGAAAVAEPTSQEADRTRLWKRLYDSRPILDNDAVTESDDAHSVTAVCFYALRKSVNLGGIYTFRKMASNEPTQTYAGSVYSLGLYCSF